MKHLNLDKFDIVRLKGLLTDRPIIGPRAVNIHLNNICRRKCIFCWYFSPLVTWKDKPRQLSFAVLKKLICDCAKMGVQTMNLEGGEVTLYPRLKDAFLLVKSKNMKLAVYSHLDCPKKHIDYLKIADSISVNLSAYDRRSYRVIHGDDHFNQVVDNLRLLNSFKIKGAGPRITLSFIIMDINCLEIEKFIDFAVRLRVEEVRFKLFTATVEMKQLVLSEDSSKKLKKIILNILSRGTKVKHNLEDIYKTMSAHDFLKNRSSLDWAPNHNDRYFYYKIYSKKKISCFVGWFYALIDESGRVIAPCDNIGVCIAGNIYKDSLRKIWFDSPAFKKIRAESMTAINIRQKKWYECRYCSYANFNTAIAAYINKICPGFIDKKRRKNIKA